MRSSNLAVPIQGLDKVGVDMWLDEPGRGIVERKHGEAKFTATGEAFVDFGAYAPPSGTKICGTTTFKGETSSPACGTHDNS